MTHKKAQKNPCTAKNPNLHKTFLRLLICNFMERYAEKNYVYKNPST